MTGGYYTLSVSECQSGIMGGFGSVSGGYSGIHGFWPSALSAPEVDQALWKSVRVHGSKGEKAIILDPTGAIPVVEPRLGGIQKILVCFKPAVPVRLVTGKSLGIDVYNGETHESRTPKSEILSNGYTQLTVQFDPDVVGNLVRFTIDLMERIASPSGLLPAHGRSCQIRSLVGDVNNSGIVDMIDMGAVKSKNRLTVTDSNFWFDVSADGLLNLLDVALTKSKYGNTAP